MITAGPELQLTDLSVTLNRNPILKNVSLKIQSGKIHALIGANGSGKSTLLKSLLGQLPHSGEIKIIWPNKHRTVAYVPQNLYFEQQLPMTVTDFLYTLIHNQPVFSWLNRRVKQTIYSVLERVNMLDKADYPIGHLSGGELKRVLLGQTLLPPANLIILDEPMTALDEPGVQVFESLLAEWKNQAATVLWVEHDLDAVKRLADLVSGINQQILFTGQPKDYLTTEYLLNLFSTPANKISFTPSRDS